jgi:long-chain-acyl-CoA dehydrogenase
LTTDEQKARWIPGMETGETITAYAITEPGAGSDVKAPRARDGDKFAINGVKTLISNAQLAANLVIVASKTTPDGRHKGDLVVRSLGV